MEATANIDAFRESGGLWRKVFENSAIGIALADFTGRFIAANAAYQKLVGYSEDELTALSIFDFTVEEFREENRAFVQELLAGKRQQFDIEKQYRRKDGNLIWVRINVSIAPGGDGKPRYMMGIIEDITHRRRLERELRESEERFRLLLDSTAEAIFGCEPDGTCIFANPAAVRLLGYDHPDDLLGKNMHALEHHSRADGTPLPLEECLIYGAFLKGEGAHSDDEVFWRKEGTCFPVEYWSHPIVQGRKTIGGVVTFFDITERKRAEEALRASEERWRGVFKNSAVGIALVDSMGRFVEANFAFQKMHGRSLEELRTLSFSEITHEEDLESSQAGFTQLVEGKILGLNLEKRYRRKDGRVVWGNTSISPILGRESKPSLFAAVVVDITERKQAGEALQEAQAELAHATRVAMMGELTASIAHEVNQPLAAVVTNGGACLRMLSKPNPDLNELSEAVADMVRDGTRASEVIARTRAVFGKQPVQRLPLSINEVINDALALTRGAAHRYGVQLQLDLASDLPPLRGDRIQLQQVVLNLIVNAVEAMSSLTGRSRWLRVVSKREGEDRALVAVRDSGAGFNPADLDRLFDTFFTTKPQGMGVGLSISRSIVEAHGGRLWAVANDDGGATFQFTLPAEGGKRP